MTNKLSFITSCSNGRLCALIYSPEWSINFHICTDSPMYSSMYESSYSAITSGNYR